MTHSPTPEEIDAVYGVEDPVETLTVLAGLHCTDAAPLIARIKADAVAEYKAKVFARGDVIGDLATIWGYNTVPAIAGQAVDDLIERMTARGAR